MALGTDFDGINAKGIEIDNIGDMDKLFIGLNHEGISDDTIEKFFIKIHLELLKM